MTTPTDLLLASEQAPDALAPVAASGVFVLIAVMIVVPLVSSALLVLGDGPRFDLADKRGHLLGTAASLASFVIGVVLFVTLLGRDAGDRSIEQNLFAWIHVGGFQVDMTFLYDPLSALFVLLITGVGTLIHVYSIGYMAHDPRRRRFFGFLNLFIAAMLTLVLAGDYLVLFLGWEGVGLASYLLIGFWQHKQSAAVAAKKAFVVNRVGDVGLALAIMLMFAQLGTTSFVGVAEGIEQVSTGTATALGLLLLLGACGKSAQVPLQSWLLDAMEGPTPVSALIHAATMVTAGVYLVVRSNYIYEITDVARTAVVVVGLVTLIAGAWIGCAKDDIKKALAGSTMSQIGYMMLAAGLGPAGYAYAIFHLITHGFFKANMFLGAGSVMHGMNDEVDMRRYGGLARLMPLTFGTFAMGYLAIIGFPGFSGFFSKDRIIEAAFGENVFVGVAAALGAGVTAFYMTRLMIMTFTSSRRWKANTHPHESPAVMTIPLVVLAVASVLGGFLVLGGWISDWLTPVTGYETHELAVPAWVFSVGITVLVAIGVVVAWATYGRRDVPAEQPQEVSFVTRAGRRDLYGDAVNEAVLMRPGDQATKGLAVFDRVGVDGVVRAVTGGIGALSAQVRRAQTGFVRSYSLTVFGGALIVLVAVLAVNLA